MLVKDPWLMVLHACLTFSSDSQFSLATVSIKAGVLSKLGPAFYKYWQSHLYHTLSVLMRIVSLRLQDFLLFTYFLYFLNTTQERHDLSAFYTFSVILNTRIILLWSFIPIILTVCFGCTQVTIILIMIRLEGWMSTNDSTHITMSINEQDFIP